MFAPRSATRWARRTGLWAQATAWAFGMLTREVSAEVPKLVGDHVVQTRICNLTG